MEAGSRRPMPTKAVREHPFRDKTVRPAAACGGAGECGQKENRSAWIARRG